jgi:hypothetical protein
MSQRSDEASGKPQQPFTSIVAGQKTGDNLQWQDTDSLQVAVQWSSEYDNDVAHDTNAEDQGPRAQGADWEFFDDDNLAIWSTPVPEGATAVNIVVIYTDVIMGPPSERRRLDANHDLPLVVGSFSGFKDGEWTVKSELGDLTKNSKNKDGTAVIGNSYPTPNQSKAVVQQVRDTLKARTPAYDLGSRPAELGVNPSQEKAKTDIDNAEGKTINTKTDTGWDIIPRAKQ